MNNTKNENIRDLLDFYLEDFTGYQRKTLERYLLSMRKWNRTYNLTSITTGKAMVIRHVLDSLSINPYLNGENVLDVGSGAGLPGIPLAIVNPDMEFFLLDSNGKKTRFLQQMKSELNLQNVVVVQDRIEEYEAPVCFDIIVSRAFSSLNEFLVNSERLLCRDGQFLAMKGVYPLSELENVSDQFKVAAVDPLRIPDLSAERHVVRVDLNPEYATKKPETEEENEVE